MESTAVPPSNRNVRNDEIVEKLRNELNGLYEKYKRVVMSRKQSGLVREIARGRYDDVEYAVLSRYFRKRKASSYSITLYSTCKKTKVRKFRPKENLRLKIPKLLCPYGASRTFRYECYRDWSIDNENSTINAITNIDETSSSLSSSITWETHRIEIGTESEWRRFAASTLGLHLESEIWKICFPLRRPWHKHMKWGDPRRFPLGHLCHIVLLIACESSVRTIVGFAALEQRMKEPFEGDVFIHDVCILPEWRRSKRSDSRASRVMYLSHTLSVLAFTYFF